jgi:hypothetical protein
VSESNTIGLDAWLKEATRYLSKESAAQVQNEIRQHYESARETVIAAGSSREYAERTALTALGDPKVANRQYRRVLLTSAEARVLREGNREARFVCSRAWLKGFVRVGAVVALFGAITLFAAGDFALGRVALAAGVLAGFLSLAPYLPLYTPSRSRIFRAVKWIALGGLMAFAFGWEAPSISWLAIPCMWPIISSEWTRTSIRRKLPVAQWPKQLYF